MAGHSKWANIQHRKGRQDAKRSKIFTKLIREITAAVKLGGSDIQDNPRLRLAVDNAKLQSMPKDTIERAIKRGSDNSEGENIQEIRYEGYGPGGVAVLVDTMTSNKNRTVAEVRHAFSKHNGNMGTGGSVAYLFSKAGLISYPQGTNEDNILEAALAGGAEDIISNDDGTIDIITKTDNFMEVRDSLLQAGFESHNAEITMRPSNSIPVDIKNAESILKLLDVLEEIDDVQKIYCNADFPEDVLAQLA